MNFYDINYIKNKIILGNSLIELKKIPSNSIDLIFADPPYFMQTTGILKRYSGENYKGVNDEWDKFKSYEEYDKFSYEWLLECKRILKKDGSIWVIGTFHNIYRLGYIIQNLEFWILNSITWEKINPTPNFKGTKFVNSEENLIWATKNKNSKYAFNYKTMKELNNNKQMGSIWKFSTAIGKERLKDDNNVKLHNTQKPEKLLERIILASSKVGDIVLDPFFGTGTTGAVAKRFLRNFIGIENDGKYIKHAEKRINNVLEVSNDITNNNFDRKTKYPTIQKLIKEGKISTQYLYNSREDKVFLNLDGKFNIDNNSYSIHKATMIFENGKYLNGWKYWYIKNSKGEKILIDEIRKS